MSGYPPYHSSFADESSDSSISDDGDEDVARVELQLLPSDSQNAYRTRNSKAAPYQRTVGTDYHKGAVKVRCKILDIVHGTLSPDDATSFASLIIFRCAFYSKRHSRRATSVDIQFVFKGMGLGTPDPEVLDIAPQGKYCLMPEVQQETESCEASGGVNAAGIGGVGAQGALKWQKVKTRDMKKYMTVIGETELAGRDYGEDDGASWALMENPLSKDGVPETFRGAILLRRMDSTSHFQCDLNILVKADRWSTISNLFASKPLDDPIWFNPQLPSTDKLRKYAVDRLGQINLTDFEDIVVMNLRSGVRDAEDSLHLGKAES